MLKKTITYTDFNGKEVTEDFYFHLSKADLIELEMSQHGEGGMAAWLKKIVDSNDGKAIINEFKKLILNSYGQKSPDGKRFVKSDALRDEFMSTEAYSTLFMELCTNTEAAANFVNGIVPAGMEAEIAKMQGEQRKEVIGGTGVSAEPMPDRATVSTERELPPEDPTGLTTETPSSILTSSELRNLATPDKPYILTQNEMIEMDSDELKSGLATGRYKLS